MILSVDPGLSKCGWAVVHPKTGRIAELGVIVEGRENAFDVSTDRIQRADRQAVVLGELVTRYRCTTLIGEAITLGGPLHVKLAMAIGLHLSWGVLTALARERGLWLFEVGPKIWQHAAQPGRKKIHYPSLEKAMADHVGAQVGGQLLAIAEGNRNHALDACAIGMLMAVSPELATRIVQERIGPREAVSA
jgi:Holliday junction resolvasome RuvABC endonuclease subunit